MSTFHVIAIKLSKAIVKSGADPEMEEVYAYGVECTLSTLLILALLITAGFILGKPLQMLVFIIAWLPLRMLVGGAHANTHWMCTLVSVGLGTVSVWLSDWINLIPAVVIIALSVCCYTVFFLTAPVVHKNHPIPKNARRSADLRRSRMRRNNGTCTDRIRNDRPGVYGLFHNGGAGRRRLVRQKYGQIPSKQKRRRRDLRRNSLSQRIKAF